MKSKSIHQKEEEEDNGEDADDTHCLDIVGRTASIARTRPRI